ncbi:MAG: DUF1648 domain-containing protein [Thiobacillus sp.]
MKKSHKIIFIISILLLAISWGVAISSWSRLPSIIPIHFGITGQPDGWAGKSVFYVFLLPVIQTLILLLLGFLYYKPQYSDIPTTMWLNIIDKKHRDHAFGLIRSMMVGIVLWVSLLMTYMSYGMNNAAISKQNLSPIILTLLVVCLVVWIVYWTIRVYQDTKKAIRSIKR